MGETPKAPGLFPGLEALSAAWMNALLPSGAGGGPMELATRLLDPRQWLGVGGAALEQPFEAVLGLPRLADVPELDRKLLRLVQAWMAVAQRGAEYGTVVSQAWVAAYGDFLQALQAAAVEGRPARSGRELLDRWTATVNERMLRAQRSDPFLQAQRRLLDAMLTSRAAERELVEIGAKAADLPTRSEIDEVHKTLHAVKRELRALKRQLAAESGATVAGSSPAGGRANGSGQGKGERR
jgi:class III poly(R)-hydroxyalkanoic acid synthase PhaE subunit